MDRAAVAAYLAPRYAAYLDATGRAATDTPDGLGPVLDDALRYLGVASAAVPTWQGATPEADQDALVQAAYRLMEQVVLDLGTTFNISDPGGSLQLGKMRDSAVQDRDTARAAVMLRFGTLGIVPGATTGSPFVTLDLNYLDDEDCDDGGYA